MPAGTAPPGNEGQPIQSAQKQKRAAEDARHQQGNHAAKISTSWQRVQRESSVINERNVSANARIAISSPREFYLAWRRKLITFCPESEPSPMFSRKQAESFPGRSF